MVCTLFYVIVLSQVLVGLHYLYSKFLHGGNSSFAPEYCSCSNGVGRSLSCNKFNLMTGAVFFNSGEIDTNTDLVIFAASQSGKYLNRDAFNASLTLSNLNFLVLPRGGKNAYKFCSSGGVSKGCSMITINAFDNAVNSLFATNYNYVVNRKSCAESFGMSETNQQHSINNPP